MLSRPRSFIPTTTCYTRYRGSSRLHVRKRADVGPFVAHAILGNLPVHAMATGAAMQWAPRARLVQRTAFRTRAAQWMRRSSGQRGQRGAVDAQWMRSGSRAARGSGCAVDRAVDASQWMRSGSRAARGSRPRRRGAAPRLFVEQGGRRRGCGWCRVISCSSSRSYS